MSENSLGNKLYVNDYGELVAASGTRLPSFSPFFSPLYFTYLVAATDWVVLFCFGLLWFRYDDLRPALWLGGVKTLAIISSSVVLVFAGAKLYQVEVIGRFRNFTARFKAVWGGIALVCLGLLILTPGAMPAGHRDLAASASIFYGFAAGGLTLLAIRYGLSMLFGYCVDQGFTSYRVLAVGVNELTKKFIERANSDRFGVKVLAVFGDDSRKLASSSISGVPVLGDVDDLLAYQKRHDVDMVVITADSGNGGSIQETIRKLNLQPLRIGMLPGAFALDVPSGWCSPRNELPGVQMMSLADLPIERSGRIIKSLFDRFAAFIALLIFSPVMLACAAGIKLTSPGPVLFRQRRIGYRNREFQVFKFRTMHVGVCNTKLTARNDSRIFAFGQIMRKLSFDELPQLFNVLLGDMSLVGPRPHMPEARAAGQLYFDVVQKYAARHRVKPGITGWAQVNGWRGPTETVHQIEQRVSHDLYYIENWSFMLDLWILMKTGFVGFFGKNAF